MGECVNVQVTDGMATIRMDRPPMNAISVQVQAELRATAATVSAAPAIRAAVIYGGEKTFAAIANNTADTFDHRFPAVAQPGHWPRSRAGASRKSLPGTPPQNGT